MTGQSRDRRLQNAFGFTDDELDANASGCISDRQRRLLDSADRGSKVWTRVATVFILLTLGVMVLVGLNAADDPPSELYVALGAVVGAVLVLFGLSAVVGRRRFADVRTGTITTATGPARTKSKRTTSEHGGVTLCRVKIGSTRLALTNRTQLDAFDDGAYYLVHFVKAPGAPIILSAIAADT